MRVGSRREWCGWARLRLSCGNAPGYQRCDERAAPGLRGESGVASVGDCSSSRPTSDPPEAEHTLVSLRVLRFFVRAG